MRIIKILLQFFLNNFINLLVLISNFFIWRTKKIWIFGSWFGDNFSDNSRFLYQFVFENKERYDIERVIWMTRNKEVFSLMKSLNYDVMLINSFQAFFYHLRSGVHIICNNASFSGYKHDINTFLSFGAKKIQLWHGVGIKACGRLKLKNPRAIWAQIYYSFINRYGQPGMWGRCYQLATSEENKRVVIQDYAIIPKKVILAYYPRNCKNQIYLKSEINVIEKLIKLKANHKIILFLPTFRKDSSNYILPEHINGFHSFLKNENYIWVQKKHSADINLGDMEDGDCVINLDTKFDVNVLYDYIDLLITDYSSASSDAIAKNKMTLEYCPDFEFYNNNDRGFVNDFALYHVENAITNPSLLFDAINRLIVLDPSVIEKHRNVRSFLVGNREWSIEEVCDEIVLQAGIKKHSKYNHSEGEKQYND